MELNHHPMNLLSTGRPLHTYSVIEFLFLLCLGSFSTVSHDSLYLNKFLHIKKINMQNADIPAHSWSVMMQNILTKCAIKKRFRASQSLKLVAFGGVL